MKLTRFIFAAALVGSLWTAAGASAEDYKDPVMDHRFDGIFHFSFGDDANTVGAEARYDRPVHKYITVGGAWGFFSAGKDGNRDPVMDLYAFIRARYNRTVGKKKKYPVEIYGIFHIGPTISFDPTNGGFNVGVAPGVQILFTKNLGLMSELGFIHRQTGKGFEKTQLSQGVWRNGIVVILP